MQEQPSFKPRTRLLRVAELRNNIAAETKKQRDEVKQRLSDRQKEYKTGRIGSANSRTSGLPKSMSVNFGVNANPSPPKTFGDAQKTYLERLNAGSATNAAKAGAAETGTLKRGGRVPAPAQVKGKGSFSKEEALKQMKSSSSGKRETSGGGLLAWGSLGSKSAASGKNATGGKSTTAGKSASGTSNSLMMEKLLAERRTSFERRRRLNSAGSGDETDDEDRTNRNIFRWGPPQRINGPHDMRLKTRLKDEEQRSIRDTENSREDGGEERRRRGGGGRGGLESHGVYLIRHADRSVPHFNHMIPTVLRSLNLPEEASNDIPLSPLGLRQASELADSMQVHMYIYAYRYIFIYIYIYVYIYMCIYLYIYIYMYLSIYVYIYIYIYIFIYLSMYLCIYVSMYLCIHLSIYLYIGASS